MPDLIRSHLIHKVTKENESVHVRNHKSGYVMSHLIAHNNREDYVTKNFEVFIIHTISVSVKVDDIERASTDSMNGGMINM
jgi:hypothetical protein